jgi:hypothetical protein
MLKEQDSLGTGMLKTQVLKPTREEKGKEKPIEKDREDTESDIEFRRLMMPRMTISSWMTI